MIQHFQGGLFSYSGIEQATARVAQHIVVPEEKSLPSTVSAAVESLNPLQLSDPPLLTATPLMTSTKGSDA